LAASDTELEAGESTTIDVDLVDGNNASISTTVAVSFTSDCFANGLASFDQTSVNTVAGHASVVYTAEGCSGTDTVTASAQDGDSTIRATIDLTTKRIVKIGSGTGDSFAEGVLTASDTELEAGESTTITVDLVDYHHVNISEALTVSFTSDCVANGLARFDQPSVDTVAGRASVVYTAAGCSGVDAVTASAQVDDTTIRASVDLTVQPDTVLSVQYDGAVTSQLALAGMGGTETPRLSFRLVGAQGTPIWNESVSFSVTTAAEGAQIVEGYESAISNTEGIVTTILRSGTAAGVVRVTATHDGTGTRGLSEQTVISTGVPIAHRFSVTLSTWNPADAAYRDGVPVQVNVIAGDQFGNSALDGTRVSFVSPESGNIESSCELADGSCSVTWISSDPRPSDGRVSIIAFTNGAEQFTDTNSNNIFEESETQWMDLPEPCVDANENGICDYTAGEYFVDGNGNGVLDGPDGAWNGPCLGSANAGARCAGPDAAVVSRVRLLVLSTDEARIVSYGSFPDPDPDPGPPVPISLPANGVTYGGLIVSDSNGNAMPAGTTITFTTDNGEIVGTSSWTVPTNVTGPTGSYGITLMPDETPSSGTLILKIESPGEFSAGPREITWEVVD
jgi:hypothetical protein